MRASLRAIAILTAISPCPHFTRQALKRKTRMHTAAGPLIIMLKACQEPSIREGLRHRGPRLPGIPGQNRHPWCIATNARTSHLLHEPEQLQRP